MLPKQGRGLRNQGYRDHESEFGWKDNFASTLKLQRVVEYGFCR